MRLGTVPPGYFGALGILSFVGAVFAKPTTPLPMGGASVKLGRFPGLGADVLLSG